MLKAERDFNAVETFAPIFFGQKCVVDQSVKGEATERETDARLSRSK